MKKLKNFISKMRIEIQLSKITLVYVLLLISLYVGLILVGILTDRIIEMLTMIPLFFIFTKEFDKQYHCETLFKCSLLTLIIFATICMLMPSKNEFLFAPVIAIYGLTFASFHVRNYMDLLYLCNSKVNSREKICKILNNKITEEEISEFCRLKGLKEEISETIYLYLNNKIEDVADILGKDTRTITRRIKTFLTKCRN